MAFSLRPIAFLALPGWREDDHHAALRAFRLSARHALSGAKPYRTGSLGVCVADMRDAMEASLDAIAESDPRTFFERYFRAFRIVPSQGGDGFVTAFYEPEVVVSARREGLFRHPFLRPPADLVKLRAPHAPGLAVAGFEYGRVKADGSIVEYADRAAIEAGLLEGRGLEIAWARDRVDVFFAHIQGAARLRYIDGATSRITFAAKSGHPFTAIGRVLVALGEMAPDKVTMQSLRAWLAENPERQDEILWQNRSFIFFREVPVADDGAGPIAAAKVPLTAGRSLAVDRTVFTFGLPFHVSAPQLRHLDAGRSFNRLLLAQDTGSAIVGAARGDIFTGSGDMAGALAGSVRHAATFHLLLPERAAQRLV